VAFVVEMVRKHRWSLDACVGYARVHNLFRYDEMVCTKTLYNELEAGNLPLTVFEVPDVLKRRVSNGKSRVNKRPKGRSIEERPAEVAARVELGHWEADTVVGLRNGKEAVVFSLVERVTDNYIAMRIPSKTSEAVQAAMQALRAEYGNRFSDVFKSITADNGSEFEDFAQAEQWGTLVYFAHPYSSWERPVNERHNGLLRGFIPKGVSIEKFSPEQVLAFADELNGRPRKRLGYQTPEELKEKNVSDGPDTDDFHIRIRVLQLYESLLSDGLLRNPLVHPERNYLLPALCIHDGRVRHCVQE
jgi:IS30 family transposase